MLFVCIGNACRSPMAEGFANHYGSDVLVASSAGLAAATSIAPPTIVAMNEMNVDVSAHIPHQYDPRDAIQFDIVVNMSGFKLPGPQPREVLEWTVADPIGSPMDVYRTSRGDLEQRVMRLILDLRRRTK